MIVGHLRHADRFVPQRHEMPGPLLRLLQHRGAGGQKLLDIVRIPCFRLCGLRLSALTLHGEPNHVEQLFLQVADLGADFGGYRPIRLNVPG